MREHLEPRDVPGAFGIGGQLTGPNGADDQQPRRARVPGQVHEQGERVGIGPLQVVECVESVRVTASKRTKRSPAPAADPAARSAGDARSVGSTVASASGAAARSARRTPRHGQ